jgi:hypothetical protein
VQRPTLPAENRLPMTAGQMALHPLRTRPITSEVMLYSCMAASNALADAIVPMNVSDMLLSTAIERMHLCQHAASQKLVNVNCTFIQYTFEY